MFSNTAMPNERRALKPACERAVVWSIILAKRAVARRRISGTN
jgi:hypothetical protein